MIAIVICCCYKYHKNYELCLEKWKDTMSKYSSVFRFFYIFGTIGTTKYNENTHILQIDVEDTYDALPKKICKAYEYILTNYPNTKGIFKTDDDIEFTNYDLLPLELLTISQSSIDYAGMFLDQTKTASLIHPLRLQKFSTIKDNVVYSYDKAIYCYGAGYYISKKAIKYICNDSEYVYSRHLEDVTIGYILNKYDIFPTQLHSTCREITRVL